MEFEVRSGFNFETMTFFVKNDPFRLCSAFSKNSPWLYVKIAFKELGELIDVQCMYVGLCMYVCMYVCVCIQCMYVCMYVCETTE